MKAEAFASAHVWLPRATPPDVCRVPAMKAEAFASAHHVCALSAAGYGGCGRNEGGGFRLRAPAYLNEVSIVRPPLAAMKAEAFASAHHAGRSGRGGSSGGPAAMKAEAFASAHVTAKVRVGPTIDEPQ